MLVLLFLEMLVVVFKASEELILLPTVHGLVGVRSVYGAPALTIDNK